MSIKFILKSKHLVTKSEREQLKRLHFRDGLMWPFFTNKSKLGIVILAKINSKIVSWGLVFERNEEKTLFLYTAPEHRRKKIATKIYQIAFKNFGDLYVSKHDKRATYFYESVGL